jgi:hypothetical protein
MSNVVFTGSYKPVDEADLCAFEGWLGSRFPEVYRTFIQRTNGGHPHKHRLRDPCACYIEGFYAITKASDEMSLYTQIPIMRPHLPKFLIAVAFTGSGDRIALDLRDDHLYHWDHEVEYDAEQTRLEELTLIADDIEELLSRLDGNDAPPADDELMKLARWSDVQELRKYLAQGGNINACSETGASLLQHACHTASPAFIEECIKHGAHLNGALHAATFSHRLPVVELLLAYGANVNERNAQGRTPLDKVPINIYRRGSPVIELLEARGGKRSLGA